MIKRYSYTCKGPRATNQDYLLIEDFPDCGLLACIADGVGGNNCGEVASKAATETFVSRFKENKYSLEDCINFSHAEVLKLSRNDQSLAGMATTLSSILIKNTKLDGVHVGDSRIYVLRGKGILQLTIDQTEVGKLLESGSMSKKEAYSHPYKNIIYSAIGSHKELIVQSISFDLMPRDRIILATDGVYSVITKKKIRDISQSYDNFTEFCEKIISTTEISNPTDNFTFIGLEISCERISG